MRTLPNENTTLSNKEWQELRSNRAVRQNVTFESFYWFFHIYLSHYISFTTADFHRQMIADASDPSIEHLVIVAFRESGKSTIITTAFPIWAVVGKLQKKYVVIVSQTQPLAQQHLKNVVAELANNQLLHKDVWPYDVEENELGVSAISLPKFNARIIAVSREQGVRGLRHGAVRPDLIIADDVEDISSVKTREGRNRTYEWFSGELLPLGSEQTKYITVGNLLHEDSLLMRLKDGFKNGSREGVYRAYPIEQNGKPLWPGRYPNNASINKLERRIGNRITFEREYRLHLVPDEEQIITRNMIRYYEAIPELLRGESRYLAIGVDPAISEKDAADCTAMITLDIRGEGKDLKMYVRPSPINGHPGFPETMDLIKNLNVVNRGPAFYVESVAYQTAIVQSALREAIDVRAINLQMDKRTRLNLIASLIQNGTIIFPKSGFEAGITQLTGFGIERYDDLVDALTIVVIGYLRELQDSEKDSIKVVGRVVRRSSIFENVRGWTRLYS